MFRQTERELYWAIWTAQKDGVTLEQFLEMVHRKWIANREDQLEREKKI